MLAAAPRTTPDSAHGHIFLDRRLYLPEAWSRNAEWRTRAHIPATVSFLNVLPQRIIGDRADDTAPLDRALAELGVEMIAPHRRNRKKPKTQDGRRLRRCQRRWTIERLFAWLGNFRRSVVRYERHALNYLGFVHLGCILILLRQAVYYSVRIGPWACGCAWATRGTAWLSGSGPATKR